MRRVPNLDKAGLRIARYYLFLIGYYFSWIATILCVVSFPNPYFWEAIYSLFIAGIDQDVSSFEILVGVILGLTGAISTRRARVFHRCCIVIGSLLAALGFLEFILFSMEAKRLKGTGPFANLGVAALSEMAFVFAWFGLFILAVGFFGRLSNKPW